MRGATECGPGGGYIYLPYLQVTAIFCSLIHIFSVLIVCTQIEGVTTSYRMHTKLMAGMISIYTNGRHVAYINRFYLAHDAHH